MSNFTFDTGNGNILMQFHAGTFEEECEGESDYGKCACISIANITVLSQK